MLSYSTAHCLFDFKIIFHLHCLIIPLLLVQQTDNSGGVIGFVHTEDQFWVNGITDQNGKAFKSVALACSRDYGRSWDNARRILTLGHKPAVASWSGTGDQVKNIQ